MALDRLAHLLHERETIEREEFEALLAGKTETEAPATILLSRIMTSQPPHRGRRAVPVKTIVRSLRWTDTLSTRTRSPGDGLPSGNGCSLAPMAGGGPRSQHESWAHFDLEEHPMTPHPFLDLAAQFARIFVLGMSAAAIVAVPVLLVLALLL